MKSTRATSSPARTIPSTIPMNGADQRGDHALVPDHPPHLAARHPDRAQHAELARPLEHGEDERVHDPEQADDHREREQHVEDVQHRVQAGDLVVDELLLRLHLRVREAASAALERRPVGVGLAALHLHERVDVQRLSGSPRPRPRRRSSRGRTASRRWAGRRCPRTSSGGSSRSTKVSVDGRADGEVVVSRRSPCRRSAPWSPSVASTSWEPAFQSRLKIPPTAGVDRGREERACRRRARRPSDVANATTPGRLRGRVAGRDRDRREVVLRGDRVAADEEVVDRAAEALGDPGREHGDERDEREPDHQRRGRRRGALRVALGVVAREAPAAPPIFVAGQPSAPASGGRRRAESSATPKKISSVPTPMESEDLGRARPLPKSPIGEQRRTRSR